MDKRFLLTGTVDETIMTCLRAAGWYEGRKVDLTEVKAFYASVGIILPVGAENFLHEYHGLAQGWYFNVPEEELLRRAPDISFELYPTYTSIDDEYFYPEFSAEDAEYLQRVESFAGESLVYVGNIGYYYPAAVYLGTTGKIYTTHDYDNIIHCYNSVPEMLIYDFGAADKWHYVSMR